MNTMKLIAMPALAALVLSACGGGGGMAPAMPETPAGGPMTSPPAGPEGEAEHNRLVLPGFAAPDVDEAMFRLAHEPYNERGASHAGGGGGLAAASLALQAGALALYEAQRAAGYSVDYLDTYGGWEWAAEIPVNPNSTLPNRVPISMTGFPDQGPSCDGGECIIREPDSQGRTVRVSLDDMPFAGRAMREGAKGYRTRGGVNLRYWASGYNPESTWPGWEEAENATDFWSGYGAWLEWSGFGVVMHVHNHLLEPFDSATYFSIVGGDTTGALPEISGSYRGAAVAMANDLSFIADGTVDMTVTFGEPVTLRLPRAEGGTIEEILREGFEEHDRYLLDGHFWEYRGARLDISIGAWQGYELNNGEIGSITDVPMDTIEARGYFGNPSGGRFFVLDGGYSIRGAFFGPSGEEFSGSFRSGLGVSFDGVHGVFGTKRQPDD